MKNKAFKLIITGLMCSLILMFNERVLACYGSVYHPSTSASCPCQSGLSSACPAPSPNYYNDPYNSCDDGTDPNGYLYCNDPMQNVGHYYTCVAYVNWANVILAYGTEVLACTAICIVTLGTACFACIAASLAADGGLTLSCAFYTCSSQDAGAYQDYAISSMTGSCPKPTS